MSKSQDGNKTTKTNSSVEKTPEVTPVKKRRGRPKKVTKPIFIY